MGTLLPNATLPSLAVQQETLAFEVTFGSTLSLGPLGLLLTMWIVPGSTMTFKEFRKKQCMNRKLQEDARHSDLHFRAGFCSPFAEGEEESGSYSHRAGDRYLQDQ